MLLNFEQIRDALDRKFLPLEPMLQGFRLRSSKVDDADIRRHEALLGHPLPVVVRQFLLTYSLDLLTVGPTVFGENGNYLQHLVRVNSAIESEETKALPWWGGGQKPEGLLMVADSISSSKSYAVLLRLSDGAILAMEHGTLPSEARVAARDFGTFVRGIATLFFLRIENRDRTQLASNIADAVGGTQAEGYWEDLVS